MFHVELRRFPHATHLYNLTEPELRAQVLDGWRTGRPLEIGERRWVPDQTRLRIIEGPELAPNELAMGRGWTAAERRGTEVTESMLAGAPVAPPASGSDRALAAELLARAAAAPLRLHDCWMLVHEARPQWPASDCLATAERALGVLLGGGLTRLEPGGASGERTAEELQALLREPASWGEASRLALTVSERGREAFAVERRD